MLFAARCHYEEFFFPPYRVNIDESFDAVPPVLTFRKCELAIGLLPTIMMANGKRKRLPTLIP